MMLCDANNLQKLPIHIDIEHSLSSEGRYMIYFCYLKQDNKCRNTEVLKVFNLRKLGQQIVSTPYEHLRQSLPNYHIIQCKLPRQPQLCSRQFLNKLPIDGNTKPDVIYAIRPFLQGQTLRYRVQTNDCQMLTEDIQNSTRNLMQVLMQIVGLNNYFITSSNLYVDCYGIMKVNIFSVVGVYFTLFQGGINWAQFREIYPYLDSKFLQRQSSQRINHKMRVRMFSVNLLMILLGKNIDFLEIQDIAEGDDLPLSICQKYIKQINGKYQKYLKQQKVILKLQEFKQTDYIQYFKKVLVEEQNLSWKQVFKALIKPVRLLQQSINNQDQQSISKFCHWVNSLPNDLKEQLKEYANNEDQVYFYLSLRLNLSHVLKYRRWYHCLLDIPYTHHEQNQYIATSLIHLVVQYKQSQQSNMTLRNNFINKILLAYKIRIGSCKMDNGITKLTAKARIYKQLL